MGVRPVDATAMAIFMFEGANKCDPTTHNIRNNNPGNLRPYKTGQEVDAGGYRVFPLFVDGWQALIGDINAKVLRMADATLVDLFNVYAPGADHNDPRGYAQFVCGWLTRALGKSVTVATRIGDIYD